LAPRGTWPLERGDRPLPRPQIALLLAVVLTCVGCSSAPESSPEAAPEAGVVARVTDGDTLRLRDGRRIRLVQIDAPERDTECYGRAAGAALARLTPPGTRVMLERDPSLDGRDGYGRLLRYVLVGELDVNLELVRLGAAAPYFFRGERGRQAGSLLSAAEAARAHRRGLWGACPDARLAPDRGLVTGA
jgi:endonuclease YncB( thermonuclease family)